MVLFIFTDVSNRSHISLNESAHQIVVIYGCSNIDKVCQLPNVFTSFVVAAGVGGGDTVLLRDVFSDDYSDRIRIGLVLLLLSQLRQCCPHYVKIVNEHTRTHRHTYKCIIAAVIASTAAKTASRNACEYRRLFAL